jgi:hypothetical protein
LIAYYSFNGNAHDSIGNHDAVIYGPAPTFGRDGRSPSAFQFNGITDYMEIPHSNELNFGRNDFSISIWLRYGAQPHEGYNYSAVFLKSNSDVSPFPGINFFVDLPLPGAVLFRVDANNAVDTANSSNKYNDNIFRNFVLVRNNNRLQIFVNGNLVNQQSVAPVDVSNTARIALGANYLNRKSQNYNGAMQNLRIYNRALTSTDILQIFQSGQ